MNPIPQEFIDHLQNGGHLVFKAVPNNPKLQDISFAFTMEAVYEARVIPGQSWIGSTPVRMLPKDKTAEQIIDAVFTITTGLSLCIGGAQLSLILAYPDSATDN